MACIGKEYSYNIAERIENILDSEFMLKYSNLKNVTSFLVEIAILLPVDEAKVFELVGFNIAQSIHTSMQNYVIFDFAANA